MSSPCMCKDYWTALTALVKYIIICVYIIINKMKFMSIVLSLCHPIGTYCVINVNHSMPLSVILRLLLFIYVYNKYFSSISN